jgi:hypothetical protein
MRQLPPVLELGLVQATATEVQPEMVGRLPGMPVPDPPDGLLDESGVLLALRQADVTKAPGGQVVVGPVRLVGGVGPVGQTLLPKPRKLAAVLIRLVKEPQLVLPPLDGVVGVVGPVGMVAHIGSLGPVQLTSPPSA